MVAQNPAGGEGGDSSALIPVCGHSSDREHATFNALQLAGFGSTSKLGIGDTQPVGLLAAEDAVVQPRVRPKFSESHVCLVWFSHGGSRPEATRHH